MKKIIVSLFVFSLLVLGKAVFASPFDGITIIEVTSSGPVTNAPPAPYRIFGAFASSDTTPGANWFVILDTAGSLNGVTYPSFASANKKSPPLYFPMVNVSSNASWNAQQIIDYEPEGLMISNTCYIMKSAVSSGEAIKVYLKIRK